MDFPRQNLGEPSFPMKHLAQVAVKDLSGEIYAEAKASPGKTIALVGLGARRPWHLGAGCIFFGYVKSH